MASLQTTLNTERRNPMLEITLIAVVALWIAPHQLMQLVQPLSVNRETANAVVKEETVVIRIHLGDGPGQGCAWGCDLSDQ